MTIVFGDRGESEGFMIQFESGISSAKIRSSKANIKSYLVRCMYPPFFLPRTLLIAALQETILNGMARASVSSPSGMDERSGYHVPNI